MVVACGQGAQPVWLVDWPQGPVMVMACCMASVASGRGHGGQ